jgi:UDP-glucuronate 4-epimerase
MRILVTGGAGFIGSHLSERLLSEGHRLTVADDLNDFYPPAEKRSNLELIRRRGAFRFAELDIRDQDRVFGLVSEERPEVIIHLAARAGVRPSLDQPLLYEQVNVGGTLTLLEAARRFGVRKFIFASSSSVYGAANRIPFRETDLDLRPLSPYAATKLAGEHLCHTYSHLYGIQAVCLRFFTVYGPRQRPDLAIRKFAERIVNGLPVPFYGSGGAARDYTYVDDTVAGIVAALRHDAPFDVFNLGNSSPVRLDELIEALERALGVKARLDRQPDQPGDVPITFADITKAREILGYEPSTPLEKGLASVAARLRSELMAASP